MTLFINLENQLIKQCVISSGVEQRQFFSENEEQKQCRISTELMLSVVEVLNVTLFLFVPCSSLFYFSARFEFLRIIQQTESVQRFEHQRLQFRTIRGKG